MINSIWTGISKLNSISPVINYSLEEQLKFKASQQLAFSCATAIAKEIQPGWSEKRTAELMDVWLKDHGVRTFFHTSFAWFGDRSSFTNFRNWLDFLPQKKRILQEDEAIILDTAPIFNSYAADIGYSYFYGGPPAEYLEAKNLLIEFRSEIPALFKSSMQTNEIWEAVNKKILDHGFKNCHKDYPLGALGHRLRSHPFERFPGVLKPFTLHSYSSLLTRGLLPEILGPFHQGEKNGLWAIEPHFGNEEFGIKFEEILIVNNDSVFWLDEAVPHNLGNIR